MKSREISEHSGVTFSNVLKGESQDTQGWKGPLDIFQSSPQEGYVAQIKHLCLSQWAPFKKVSVHSKNVLYNKSIFHKSINCHFQFMLLLHLILSSCFSQLIGLESYICIFFFFLIWDLCISSKKLFHTFHNGIFLVTSTALPFFGVK